MVGKKLLLLPGPIDFDPEVLQAMARPTPSHMAADFSEEFGQALERMREVWLAPQGQPFVVAGSGTLAMDLGVANLVEPGDRGLVINTGYFSDRMVAILDRYGCQVDQLTAPVGDRPSEEDVEAALGKHRYKVMTMTHVDTSTGVLADAQTWAGLARKARTLTILDGVCSVGGEELRQEDWGIDVALTASQKAIGVPPGLALLVASPKAIDAFRRRRHPVGSYYADWTNWLPIMESYESRKPGYFGTPPVNLVLALNVSLGQIVAEGMEERFRRHKGIGSAFRAAIRELGLGQVPVRDELAACTMTAPLYPEGVDASMLGYVKEAGAIFAGGLHPQIRNKYFRIGHMGSTCSGEVLATVSALEWGLKKAGYRFEPGSGVAAAQRVLCESN
jgi:alanine-glyoxylate transaminase/serine-glyoxylate transaminase/serine-pyruvate transaminase